MQTAPIPENDGERLEALRQTELLDSTEEVDFDEIAELASLVCGTPIALVSLVDAGRQWFKARVGLDATETPRDVSFCGHAIHEPGAVFSVPDALEDIRFHDNPLVTGAPLVRSYHGRPLVHHSGHAIGTLCVIDHEPRQLTQAQRRALEILGRRVEAEIELRRRRREAEELSQAKSRFLSTMSHEIRTPLAGLLGTLDLVLDGELEPPVRSDLEGARAAARLLEGLLSTVLDVSKATNGRLETDSAPFDLHRALHDLGDVFRASARAGGLDLLVEVDEAVPRWVRGDAQRLAQVLGNLAGNAVKFTHAGGVTIGATTSGERVRFRVTDTGKGIAKEQQPRIFEEFEQVEGTRGGTGLGLSLASKLVAIMGGELRVESEPGAGSEFSFELPLPTTDPVATSTPPAEERFDLRVLLVDDEPLNLRIGRRVLERMGATVDVAGSGGEALEAIAAFDLDAVFLDCQMGDMDGHEVARRVREREARPGTLPIFALTAEVGPAVERTAREAGMDGVLAKPIDRARMASALRLAAERRAKRDDSREAS